MGERGLLVGEQTALALWAYQLEQEERKRAEINNGKRDTNNG